MMMLVVLHASTKCRSTNLMEVILIRSMYNYIAEQTLCCQVLVRDGTANGYLIQI